ncbi:MAG TPA: nucleotide exchange factor GrpE [Methanosarcinaceae archaeon]|nr:nucleotide exchange factor GrpE [Methanosarcinaceae archaeon]
MDKENLEENDVEPDMENAQGDEQVEERSSEDEIAELNDKLLRLGAEFDNFRKRSKREKEELRKYATENLMVEMLEVCDNFERALHSAKAADDSKSIVEGVEMVLKQFISILEKEGVKKIECKGEEFDPYLHEAMMHIVTIKHPDNTIIDIQKPGYMLHSKVIRPVMVTVAKKPEDDSNKSEK